MIILKTVLILALVIPANANNTDEDIIKNLDFFQNIDLIKDENPFAYKKSASVNTNSDQSSTQYDVLVKDSDAKAEKKQ